MVTRRGGRVVVGCSWRSEMARGGGGGSGSNAVRVERPVSAGSGFPVSRGFIHFRYLVPH